jgi:flavin reductase (DIM6/NTAB) family NADH-FMN oxidoreductase RutF
VAWIDCTVEDEHDGGDHVIVVGRVQELDVADDGKPLIFYRGGYGRFEP